MGAKDVSDRPAGFRSVLVRAALFAVLYVAGAELGHWLSIEPGHFATFWPPAGIYLIVLLRSARGDWPAYIAAAVAANLATDSLLHGRQIAVSFAFAWANTAEAVLGASLLRHWAGSPFTFSGFRNVLALTLAIPVSTSVGALLGSSTVALALGGSFWNSWRVWWIADVIGILVAGPLVLTAFEMAALRRPDWKRISEGAVLLLALAAATEIIFGSSNVLLNFPYFVSPFLLWAALRLGTPGVSAAVFTLAVVTVRNTVLGNGPFAGPELLPEQRVWVLQVFLSLCALSSLVLAAVKTEWENAKGALVHANSELERRVQLRTLELAHTNDELSESQRRLSTLLSHLPGMVYRCPTEQPWPLTFVSDGVHGLTGRTADDFMQGRVTWLSVMHPEDIAAVSAEVGAALEEKRIYTAIYRIFHHSGDIRWVVDRGQPIYAADGSPVAFEGFVGDLTAHKKAEESLRESEQRYRLVCDAAHDAIWDWDLETGVVAWNERMRTIFGYELNDVGSDTTRFARIHPDDRDRVVHGIHAAIDGGQDYWQDEYRYRRTDGTDAEVFDRGRVLRDNGKPVRMVGSMLDLTDRRRIERELRKQTEALLETDRRKNEFLATLSHELRNPLAPISNALQIMRMAEDDRALRERTRNIMERQLQQLVRLTDDLLDVSRITGRKLELRPGWVDLAQIVQNAVETASPLIESRGHRLTVTLPDQPVLLYADLARMAQVLSNLLTNSAKYTPPNGDISLTAERRDSELEISVRDNGIGIPPEKLPLIFEAFVQMDQSLEKTQGGLGLGLTLVKQLVQLHAGSVTARSDGAGSGSEFIVRLPLATPVIEQPAMKEGDAAPSAFRFRILVADDNVDSAESLQMMLSLRGAEVRLAHDGLEAVRVASEFKPAVILLDIGMPKLNGYEAARIIRKEPWAHNTRLIAMTGWGQEEDKRRAQEAGFDHHLTKPVDPPSLEKLLTGMMPRKLASA